MQIALWATVGKTRLRGAGLGRSRDLRSPPRPRFGKGRSRRFRLPVAAGQSPAPFPGTRGADRIGTRAFRRARRRRTQVVFRPGGVASALLYNNRAEHAGDALLSPSRPPPATPPSGSGAASVLSCLRVVPMRLPTLTLEPRDPDRDTSGSFSAPGLSLGDSSATALQEITGSSRVLPPPPEQQCCGQSAARKRVWSC